ncbi:MAG: FHA domain-containing serine/threonine-protein kinase [Planctomycetota bacterium]
MSELGLLPLHGLAGGPLIVLPPDEELGLGRDPGGSGVKIADPRCSRRHAVVYLRNGTWYARDLDSKNGTWVNGERISGEIELHRGDHVRIGHAEFAFTGQEEAFRCASCLRTLVSAPPEAPFCTECRRSFPLLGGSLAQRRLVRGLGNGSFGSVYVGHRRGNPYVALKVLHVEFTESPEVVMKFLKEAYATSHLEHENIVRFGDSGHEAGHWFIILEFFPSHSLREILEEREFLPVDESLSMAQQVLSALEYAHKFKLLHRDVKPGNILLNNEGKVKVVDFGLAKRLVDSAFTQQTSTGMPGTPLFMAPELLAGGKTTYKADIYSTAATFYRALTGRHPIEAKKLNEWLGAIQAEIPPPASSVRPEISQRVSDALDRALAKSPKDRHPSMREFRRDLGL